LLTLAADGKAAPALPEGIVGFLMFRLSEQAKPFVITIKPDVISFEAARQPVQEGLKINVQPGSITVENQDELPGMTCFFFSH